MSVNNYNLGINNYHNYHSYNKNSQNNMNSHTIQGKLFNKYNNKYKSIIENKGGFLTKLTSGFGSVIEAMESIESVQKSNDDLKRTSIITEQEDEMNKLTSEYSTMYNTYTENSGSMTDKERKDIEEELLVKKNRLKLLSENIKNEMNRLLSDNNIVAEKETETTDAIEGMQGFDADDYLNLDEDTVRGKLETTKLRMTSNYYYYLVYFIISITLLSFTFNVLVNPNADVMNALFVVGGIVVIFLISKMMS